MLFVPTVGWGYQVNNDDSAGSGTTYGTNLTASGSTNTKGTWTAIHSTITYDLYWHRVTFTANGTTATDMQGAAASRQGLIDLGIGPDASNVTVVAENLLCGSASTFGGQLGRNYLFPLYIPAGTQLWARLQGNVASITCRAAVASYGNPDRSGVFPVIQYIESIGANTGTSVGTSITPGSNGAMGTDIAVDATANSDYCGFFCAMACEDTTMGNLTHVANVLVGADAEEDLGNLTQQSHNSSEFMNSMSWPTFFDCPVGTSVGARASCTGTPDATMSIIAYGMIS